MIFKSNTAEAVRWWKNGDHPKDNPEEVAVQTMDGETVATTLTEGEFVRVHRPPAGMGPLLHTACGSPWAIHGEITAGEEDIVVCPGDWIVRGKNNHYRVVHPGLLNVEDGIESTTPYVPVWSCAHCDAEGTTATLEDGEREAAVHATEASHVVYVYGVEEE